MRFSSTTGCGTVPSSVDHSRYHSFLDSQEVGIQCSEPPVVPGISWPPAYAPQLCVCGRPMLCRTVGDGRRPHALDTPEPPGSARVCPRNRLCFPSALPWTGLPTPQAPNFRTVDLIAPPAHFTLSLPKAQSDLREDKLSTLTSESSLVSPGQQHQHPSHHSSWESDPGL